MSEPRSGRRPAKRRPDLNTVFTINEDGSRNFLHPADVKGRWQLRKNLVFGFLITAYLAMPWIQIGGRPMIHIDLPGRAAHLFGATFTNQDFHLVFFLVTGIGFGLFALTSLWGRVWCGYFCPQTVFMEGVARRMERWIEGPRNQRIRRNLGPLTFDKAWRKVLKHLLFAAVALLFTHTFLTYFLPVRELLSSSPKEHWVAFLWTCFWAAVLYIDFAWFREQTCLIICPYGRLQSTLVDADTVTIGYDTKRGEPRGKKAAGDCIDCYRCVEVCPTGIDIRNGVQMECIGCANCVDACDEVMARTGRRQGLVRYDSLRGLVTGRRQFLRPRVWIYLVMAVVGLSVFSARGMKRTPFHASALRSAGMPFTLEGERIRNLHNLHLQNKTDDDRTYTLSPAESTLAEHPDLTFLLPQETVELESLEAAEIPIFVELDRSSYSGSFPIEFAVTDAASGKSLIVEVRFLGP